MSRIIVQFVIAATFLLSTLAARAESSFESGPRTAKPGASAHLDFKIVIPPSLALSIDEASIDAVIFSNTRHVSFAAPRPAAADQRHATVASATTSNFLMASRHSVIATSTTCQAANLPLVTAAPSSQRPTAMPQPVTCTVAVL